MGHIERKLREKENTKNNILKAALDIAIADGWQAVTIRRIAEAIEYTTSIVYEHFENKEALLLEITNYGFRLLNQQGEKILSEELEPAEQLLKVSLSSWDFARNNKELYHLMFSMGKPSNEDARKGMASIVGIFTKLTGKSEDEIESYILNWICLRLGAINLLMNYQYENDDHKLKAREFYVEFIKRFISSISK
jgi:AcrR family transcriptional regulator